MNLPTIAPNFFQDMDEEWQVYLPIEKQKYMKDKRLEYIVMDDDLSTLKSEYLRCKEENKHKDQATKNKVKLDYDKKRKTLELEQKNFVASILPKIKAFKAEALEERKRRIEEDANAVSKRRRLNQFEPDAVVDMEDVELVPDDYLPNYMPSEESHVETNRARIHDNTPMDFTNLTTSPTKTSKKNTKEVDSFIEGVEPKDAEILLELRPLIDKYDCRDRVLKAIRSIRSRDKSVKALDVFTKAITQKLSVKK